MADFFGCLLGIHGKYDGKMDGNIWEISIETY